MSAASSRTVARSRPSSSAYRSSGAAIGRPRSGSCQVAHRPQDIEHRFEAEWGNPAYRHSRCQPACRAWALGAIPPALCPTAVHQAARPRITFAAQVAWIPAGQRERDCGEPSRTEPDESQPAESHKVGGSIPSLPTTSTLPWSTSPGRLGCCGPSPGGPRPCPGRRGVAGSRGRAAAPRALPRLVNGVIAGEPSSVVPPGSPDQDRPAWTLGGRPSQRSAPRSTGSPTRRERPRRSSRSSGSAELIRMLHSTVHFS